VSRLRREGLAGDAAARAAAFPERLDLASGGVFAGREAAIARLHEAFALARGGERCIALVTGEPGIGKTRLAVQFMEMCEAEGALALYGRCDADTHVPYQPFVEALRRYAARTSLDRLTPWRAELSRVIPELWADQEPAPEATDRYRLFDAAAELVIDMAKSQPVVLVLDDLH